jgi:hypothetical protein
VELLIKDKKKVIVNVDRIKPYRIQEASQQPEKEPRIPTTLRDAPTTNTNIVKYPYGQ